MNTQQANTGRDANGFKRGRLSRFLSSLNTEHPSTPLRAGRTLNTLFALLTLLLAASAYAGDGRWIGTSGRNGTNGNWSASTKWDGGIIADGAGFTADFSTLNITTNCIVTNDAARTIGHLKFGDTTPSHYWTLTGTGTLTLDGGGNSPTITVNNQPVMNNQRAFIACKLDGTSGLTKAGNLDDQLWLSGPAAHGFTGGITVNAGMLGVEYGEYFFHYSIVTGSGVDNMLNTANSVTLNGCVFSLVATRKPRKQTVSGITLGRGESEILTASGNGASGVGTMDVELGGITRNSFSTLLFRRQWGGTGGTVSALTNSRPLTTASNDGGGGLGPWAFYWERNADDGASGRAWRYATKSTDTVSGMAGGVIKGLAGTDRGNANSFVSGENDNFNAGTTLTGSKTAHTARYTGTSASTTIIADGYTLTLNGLMNAGTTNGAVLPNVLSGALTITNVSNGALVIGDTAELVVCAAANAITIAAPITDGASAGRLIKAGSSNLTLSAVNTYTGDTWVNKNNYYNQSTLVLADNAGLKFKIGASNVNNRVRGNGTLTLDGDFYFDLTGAGTKLGDSWTIVDKSTLTAAFGTSFTVNGFDDIGANKWRKDVNGCHYEFNEANGVLSITYKRKGTVIMMR